MDPGEGRTLDAETRHRKGTSPHSSTLAVNRDNFESKSLSSTSSEVWCGLSTRLLVPQTDGSPSLLLALPIPLGQLPAVVKCECIVEGFRIDRTVSPPSNPHCQRQRSSGSSGKKTRCICSSCQQERTATTPPQRSFRYGQFLGGSEAMPIYAGPLGLGDDIPSPTPSPPPPGRMSIHMAMRGRSPISSPSGSPLLTMSHSSLPVSTATKGKSVRRGLQDGSLRSASAQDVTDSSPSTSSHPVVTGFQSQALDPKVRSSKKSPRTTAHSPPEATPLSYSPSSPSSPTCPSSLTKSTFQAETEKDTSPSLSPFFLSKRSFSPPGQASSFSSALSTSPPMRADTLHTHNMLQQSTSVSDQLNSSSSLKLPSNSGSPVSNSDSPRLAPPVVLVQSPTVESLSGFSEASPRLIPHQTGDRNPLLYSSVLASSTASSTTPVSPNFSRSPRSPSQQPLSPGSQHGAAATPPLSPSRKKEGHHHSVLSGLEKKEFESWSFSGQIQDRVIRTSPTPQYKSALLSSGPKEKTHLHRQSQIQQPKIFSRHQPSNAQQQRQQHQSHSQSTSARSSQTNLASQESNPNKRLWQARGQSLSKDPVDGTLKKAAVDAKSSRKDAGEGDRGVPRNMSGDTSATASQSALKKSESSGSSLHVLRRSRSAPILASGQISCKAYSSLSVYKWFDCSTLPTEVLTRMIYENFTNTLRCRYSESIHQDELDAIAAECRLWEAIVAGTDHTILSSDITAFSYRL
ncbi:hypothetical protein EDD21DRAFT_353597 [Dissophora ornata]|nr:hypothetical protein EDD21DRAFT_353597 [Dissophora ornata]